MGEEALISALNGLRQEVSDMRQDQRELFSRVRDIELKQANNEGEKQGSKDIFSRTIAVLSALISAVSVFIATRGGGHG